VNASLPPERLLGIIETQNDIVSTALDVNAVMRLAVVRAQGLTNAEGALIELTDGDEMICRAACGTAAMHIGRRVAVDASRPGLCLRSGDIVQTQSAVCVPVRHRERVVGVLTVCSHRPASFDGDDAVALTLLSGVLGSHLSRASALELERDGTGLDALTGLADAPAFDRRIEAEIARVRRWGGDLVLAVLDIDRLDDLNDTLGRAAGDAALRAVARHLRSLRVEDSAFRIGGDEFAVLLVGAAEAGGAVVLNRLERAIADDVACRGVTVSGGVAALRFGEGATALVARADAALRAAKRAHRAERPPVATA
jgi:diguanylate cyclase (GGDEF)-like protein